MATRAKQAIKEANIKSDYEKLANEKRYSRTYICQQLSLKYFMEATTIERIVWGEYDTRRRRDAARQQPSHYQVVAV